MPKSFITNISFPKSLNEVLYFMNMRGQFDVQNVMTADYVEWTAPKDAYIGEMVYFMHSKTSIDTIRRLKRDLHSSQNELNPHDRKILSHALDEGKKLYDQVGGSIFAYGKVCNEIIIDDIATRDGLHWRSVYYAPINNISLIEPPIQIAKFRDFIKISRTGAVTQLNDKQDALLRELCNLDTIHASHTTASNKNSYTPYQPKNSY